VKQRRAAGLQKLKGESTAAKITPQATTPLAFDLDKALASLGTSAGDLKKNPARHDDHPLIARTSVEGSLLTTSTTDPYGLSSKRIDSDRSGLGSRKRKL
jgi:hypothetical protein